MARTLASKARALKIAKERATFITDKAEIKRFHDELNSQEPNVQITINTDQELMEVIQIHQMYRDDMFAIRGSFGTDILMFEELIDNLKGLLSAIKHFKYSIDTQFDEETPQSQAIIELINQFI